MTPGDDVAAIAVLAACPFCGGEAAYNTVDYSEPQELADGTKQKRFHGANCIRCMIGTGHGGLPTQNDAAAVWNARALPNPDPRL